MIPRRVPTLSIYDNLINLTAGDSDFSISFASSTIAIFIFLCKISNNRWYFQAFYVSRGRKKSAYFFLIVKYMYEKERKCAFLVLHFLSSTFMDG